MKAVKKALLQIIVFTLFSCDLSAYIRPYETSIVNYLKAAEISEFESGIDLIDCIYVINLDKRKDKWTNIKSIFDRLDIKVNRFSGVNGWLLTEDEKQDMSGPYPYVLCGGQFGCILSHVSVLKDAYDRGFNLIWICEDDVEFVYDFNYIPHLLSRLTQIDPEWDIFYTDSNQRDAYNGYYSCQFLWPRPDQELPTLEYFKMRKTVGEGILKIKSRTGTHSMIFSRKGIEKALKYLTHVDLYCPIDFDLHYIPGIREYCSEIDIVTNSRNFSESDTQQR